MFVWWMYQCEEGRSWSVFRDEDAVERPEDAVCPDGHEAVTLTKMPPADVVRVGLIPAARISDRVTGRTWKDKRYLLEVSTWSGETRLSEQDFDWMEGIRRMSQFEGLSRDRAWSRWDRLGLGNQFEDGVLTGE